MCLFMHIRPVTYVNELQQTSCKSMHISPSLLLEFHCSTLSKMINIFEELIDQRLVRTMDSPEDFANFFY